MTETNSQGSAADTPDQPDQKPQTFAFIAMTCLFFFWGFITVLNDILIPFLKESFDLTYTQAMLVQFCFFGAYFIVSPLANRLIDRTGFQMGIVIGLLTTAAGCLLFYPSADLNVYVLFLVSFFVLAFCIVHPAFGFPPIARLLYCFEPLNVGGVFVGQFDV